MNAISFSKRHPRASLIVLLGAVIIAAATYFGKAQVLAPAPVLTPTASQPVPEIPGTAPVATQSPTPEQPAPGMPGMGAAPSNRAPLVPPQAPSNHSAYLGAVWNEEMNGDLAASLRSFSSQVADFDARRSAAADTIFHLGEIYRRLGRTEEARIQFSRLLREFIDLPDVAKRTQASLAALPLTQTTAAQYSHFAATPEQIASAPAIRDLLREEVSLLEKEVMRAEELVSKNVAAPAAVDEARRQLLEAKVKLASAESLTKAAGNSRAATSSSEDTRPDRNRGVTVGEAQLQSETAELDQLQALSKLLHDTERPETISTKIINDPRFEKLKAAYETSLTDSAMPEPARAEAEKNAVQRLSRWVAEVYIPELDTAIHFSEAKINALHEQRDKEEAIRADHAAKQARSF